MRHARRVTAALAAAMALAGCGAGAPPPVLVAVNAYLNAIGNGSYGSACALLDPRARAALARASGIRSSCALALEHCLPDNALSARHDQTQLLYATVVFHVRRRRGDAEVSGTPVARMIRRVTLAKEGRRWRLTSFAAGIRRCSRPHGRAG
jgi:hypothetical protein